MLKKKNRMHKMFQEGYDGCYKRTYVLFFWYKEIYMSVRQWKSVSSLVGTLHGYIYTNVQRDENVQIDTHSSSIKIISFLF